MSGFRGVALTNCYSSIFHFGKFSKFNNGVTQRKKIESKFPVDKRIYTLSLAKLERWKKHFEQILNRPVPPDLANITEAKEDLDINLEPITIDEIIAAIRKLKNNKAPGEDGICAEMLKQKRMLHQKFSIKYSKIYGKPRIFPKG